MTLARGHCRGFTLVEVGVLMGVVMLLSALTTAITNVRTRAMSTQDQAQIRGVMAGTVMSSRDFNDKFISPDLLAREPFTKNGVSQYRWGRGTRVIDWNSTESLVSAMIMREYLEPIAFISPVDVNPYVGAKGQIEESGRKAVHYNFDCWDPVSATTRVHDSPAGFWDTTVSCDLADDGADHNSYANSTLCGHRLKKWNVNEGHDRIAWATRATKMGVGPGHRAFDTSPALGMLGDRAVGIWTGHMAHADGSVTVETTFTPVLHDASSRGLHMSDNVYDAEFKDEYVCPHAKTGQRLGAGDNFLTYSNNAGASGTAVAMFPDGRIDDTIALARCTWDTDADWSN